MTFYENLEKHLSVKQHVLVQDEDGDYCVFSQFTDSDGFFRRTPFGAYEIAMMYIGCGSGFSKELIEENAEKRNWKIIKAFDIPTGRFQVGDKVVVSEDVIEICKKYKMVHRADTLRAMKGKACVVMNSWGDYGRLGSLVYFVILKDSKGVFSHVLPHEALYYPIETKEESFAFVASYKGKRFEMFGIDQYKDGRIQITTEEDLGFAQYEKITLNDRVYTIKDVRHNSPNFFMYNDFIVIEAYPEEENTAAQEAITLLEKNGYVISKK